MDLQAKHAEIKRRLGLLRGGTAPQAFGRAAVSTMADNIAGVPDAMVTSLAPSATTMDVLRPREAFENGVPHFGPLDVAGRAVRALSGGRVDPVAAGADYVRDPVRVGDRILGLPRGAQMVNAALAASDVLRGDAPGPRDAYAARAAQGAALRDDFPVASTMGDVGGDIATLFAGRVPFANRIAQAEQRLARLGPVGRDQTLMHDISDLFTAAPMKSLYRGLGRTAETGLEGATLSMLKGGDPLEAAGYSAGVQAFGSVAQTATHSLFRHPFIASALAAGALFQIGKEVTPGGDNRFLPSLEAGFEHVAHGLMLGGAAALTTSRLRGADKSAAVRALGDLVTTTGRGSVLSLVTDLAQEEEKGGSDIARTLERLTTDPDAFNVSQLKRLEAAIEDRTFGATVADLLKTDPRFARALGESAPARVSAAAGGALKSKHAEIKRRLRQLSGGAPEADLRRGPDGVFVLR